MSATLSPSVALSRAEGLALHAVLTLAMALPMLILYAVGALGPYLVADLGIAPGWLGYMTMSTFGLAAILSPWAGPVVQRLGSRMGMRLLFCGVALAYGLMLVLPGFAGMLVAVAGCGVAQALSNPVTNLLIAERVAPHKKAFAVGLKQSGVQMAALFAGTALAGAAGRFGWRAAVAGVIPLALLLALAGPMVAARRGASGPRKPFQLVWPHRLLALLMGVQCCAGMALSAFVTFLPLFATQHGVPARQAGSMVAVFGAMGIVSRVVLTPMGSRFRDESHLLAGLLAAAALSVSLVIEADSVGTWALWLAAIGMGLTAVATNAVAMGMLLRDRAFGEPANASGWLSAAFFGGFAIGAPAAGWIAGGRGFSAAWLAVVAVLLIGASNAWVLARLRRARTDP